MQRQYCTYWIFERWTGSFRMEALKSIKKALGKRVRELRKAAGYKSVGDLAEEVGVSPTSIYELERGENWVSPEMVGALAVALRCPVSALFQGVGSETKPAKLALFEFIATLDDFEAEDVLAALQPFMPQKGGSPESLESPKTIQKPGRVK